MLWTLFAKNGLAISGQIIRTLEQPNVFKSTQNAWKAQKTLGTELLANNWRKIERSIIICEKLAFQNTRFWRIRQENDELTKNRKIKVFFSFV